MTFCFSPSLAKPRLIQPGSILLAARKWDSIPDQFPYSRKMFARQSATAGVSVHQSGQDSPLTGRLLAGVNLRFVQTKHDGGKLREAYIDIQIGKRSRKGNQVHVTTAPCFHFSPERKKCFKLRRGSCACRGCLSSPLRPRLLVLWLAKRA